MTKPFKCVIINTERGGNKVKKKNKAERKMTAEQLQGLLHMRKRGYVQKNGKAYNRKRKHKNLEKD